jgi:pyridoxine kinase
MRGRTPLAAAALAADFTLAGMKATSDDKDHWYGTKFEKALPQLIAALGEE